MIARRRREGAQVLCVAVLPNGRIVSGSIDDTLKVWDATSGTCLHTLTGHTSTARHQCPKELRIDCSSTPRGAQVMCVAVLSKGRVVSGSGDSYELKVWEDVEVKMAHEVALYQTQKDFAGDLIAEFL